MSPRSKQRTAIVASSASERLAPVQTPATVPSSVLQRGRGHLGGSPIGPRETAALREIGGHPAGASAPPFSPQHPYQPNNAMSEKTTKTIESADVPGHDKKVETHTEEIRHQPETKVETKTESKEDKPE